MAILRLQNGLKQVSLFDIGRGSTYHGYISMIRFEAVTFLLNQQVQGDQITAVRGPCVAITHLIFRGQA